MVIIENKVLDDILIERNSFQDGKQVEVTPLIKKAAESFISLNLLSQFSAIHAWIFDKFQILPYDSFDQHIVTDEAKRRWKLTADELLQIGTIYDGKYCNDVVTLFNSLMLALGHEARVAKVFKQGNNDEIIVHSLSIIRPSDQSGLYAINTGSKDNYWVDKIQGYVIAHTYTRLANLENSS